MPPAKKSKTKSTEEKEEKKTSTKKSSTRKKNSNVKLTFKPYKSATSIYSCSLSKKVVKVQNGREIVYTEPKIEGLPKILSVSKGEVIEVTQDQFEQLQELGFIETEEARQKRMTIENNLKQQHPTKLTEDMLASPESYNILPKQAETLYSDKLIVVE